MGRMGAKLRLVTVRGRALRCVVCGHREFSSREVKLNSTGAEFLGLGWANRSALAVICGSCGYVHEFAGPRPDLWRPEQGYPAEVEVD
ncbi:Nucleic-acid-binding protein containing Zn-ribbon domain [Amycolatopsis saalfeldensis]|uniref:Nucleic-acid-binding protein containing Zn-ribbon domain n=2 Tax=Amycolatopsis saalfeldensis TaxID=394193 RepID=A0A1H8VL96_9PSEU|nr:Nucleic-acid-binding protein containing Zn-ribbon domain [Amycolatopsis saalfeldensis]